MSLISFLIALKQNEQVASEKLYSSANVLLEQKVSCKIDLTQEQLDLTKGRNTNLFSYKGQFSPDFIANLLQFYAKDNAVVFDPFVGSGTVLFEAAKKGLTAFGTEINPAAYEMANTAIFLQLSVDERIKELKEAQNFALSIRSTSKENDLYQTIERKIKSCKNVFTLNILKNAYISLLSSKKPHTIETYVKCIKKHSDIILNFPVNQKKSVAYLSDARNVPIEEHSIDLIITSPPYINVFNYHQHNRSFIDRIYNNALIVAKSEFGANRKHRQNRFLTVIQYILDMVQTFEEMKRVLKPDGRMILIIGKSSKVRGVDFRNDYIIAGVAQITGYELKIKQERKFLNQYGEKIYEEILHFVPTTINPKNTVEIARNFARDVLKSSKGNIAKDIAFDIDQAIEKAPTINPSTLLSI